MPGPEQDGYAFKLSPMEKLAAAGTAFLVAAAVAAPAPTSSEESKASPDEVDAAEIARCKEEYPPHQGTLTLNDYLDIERWDGGYHKRPAPSDYMGYDKKTLFEMAKRRLRLNQLNGYETSPERAERVETHVNRFAAGAVERAASGDPTYTFYSGGSGAFLDGSFLTGPQEWEKIAKDDNYEGFGWLWRQVPGEGDEVEKREIINNIYRYSDGTYYEHPEPTIMGVSDKNAQSTFEHPSALGLLDCSSVPGNGVTQGWRVSHYDFNHLYDPRFDTIQKEPWMNSGNTIAEVQLTDRRAAHFIEDRYNPDVQP